jgi:hypothetical protein
LVSVIEVFMVVQTQGRRDGVVGLHIGGTNVERYFSPNVPMIELELDHVRILCPLESSFWEDHPVIHDLRLSSWLEAKRCSGKLSTRTGTITMTPCGKDAFRLQPMAAEQSEESQFPVTFMA